MTRIEFLGELSRRLHKLPKEELDNVLSYYDEIFLDAGIENEAKTAENLGSIDDIARQILIENNISPDGEPEYFVRQNTVGSTGASGEENAYSGGNYSDNSSRAYNSGGMSMGIKLLILVLTFPIWLPVLITVVSVAFSLIVAAVAVIFGLCVAGVTCVVTGIAGLLYEPMYALITMGIGLVICGLMGVAGVPFFKWLLRMVKNGCNSLFNWCHDFIYNRRSA